MSTPYLALEAVSCERQGRLLVDRLDWVIELGQAWQIEGPNGSGKTTLLRVLTTLSADYRGQIRWQGIDLKAVGSDYLQQLLYIGHAPGIKGVLSPRENLHWAARLLCAVSEGQDEVQTKPSVAQIESLANSAMAGAMPDTRDKDINQAIQAALARVGLAGYEDIASHHLSAGQQRRVALAKLFLFARPLWILDEPFTAVDRQGVVELESAIDQHVQQGGLVILTTHHTLSLKHGCRKLCLGDVT